MSSFALDKNIFTPELYQRVQDIWLGGVDPNGEEVNMDVVRRWFMGTPEERLQLDKKCSDSFLEALDSIGPVNFSNPTAEPFIDQLSEMARNSSTDDGAEAASAALSIAILLDQMPRNIFRSNEGLVKVYSHYDKISEAFIRTLFSPKSPIPRPDRYQLWRSSTAHRMWFYMPLCHSEDVEAHKQMDGLLEDLQRDLDKQPGCAASKKLLDAQLTSEKEHREIIDKFGRYPHRNGALGRETTEEEAKFMSEGGATFGMSSRADELVELTPQDRVIFDGSSSEDTVVLIGSSTWCTCDGEHVLTRRPLVGISAAEPALIDSAYRSCLLATGVTAIGAILGAARPGGFLRNVTFFGILDGTITACDIYGRQDLNRAIFKETGLDNPKPFKLWERTKQWTLEDASLFGGATGLLIASNSRLFPGVNGFSRFFGVAVAGYAVGAKTAEWAFSRYPLHHIKREKWVLATQQRSLYQELSRDEQAKASLSRFGKALLVSYTGDSPLMRLLSKPFGRLTGMASAGHSHAQDYTETVRRQIQQEHAKPPVDLMLIEFEREELAAPDYDGGYRQYKMDPADTSLDALQEHLEHLNKLRVSEGEQLAYVWHTLVPKEQKLHGLSQEDPDKDLLRRELQLLNSIASHTTTRLAVISYAQADALKRIAQIRNDDSAAVTQPPILGIEESSLDANWRENYVPQKIAERIRRRWEETKSDMVQREHVLAQFDELKARGILSTAANEKAEQIRESYDHMKQNILATERLLKEFEDRILEVESRRADPPRAMPAADRAPDTITGFQSNMSSLPLRPLRLEVSPQSNETETLPHSPPRRSTDRSSLSPADCRTLEKVLRHANISSPPRTPSPLEQGEQPVTDAYRSVDISEDHKEEEESYQPVSGEATDTGYEDEDDSMELSDGSERGTADHDFSSFNSPDSPSVSRSDRRLQDSVSTHDEKDRLIYNSRRSSVTKQLKVKRREQGSDHVAQGETLEGNRNLSEKRTSSEHSEPDGAKSLHGLRFSLEKVLEDDHVEQEHAEMGSEPGVSIVNIKEIHRIDDSDLDGFQADNEETVLRTTGAQRRRSSQSHASKSGLRSFSVNGLTRGDGDAELLVPNTPTSAVQPPGCAQAAPHQSIPETPFTNALSYYKQVQGKENSSTKRRRNTALYEELAERMGRAAEREDDTCSPDHKELGIVQETHASPTPSALVDLKELVLPGTSDDIDTISRPVVREVNPQELRLFANASSAENVGEDAVDAASAVDDDQKQLILYPRHPAFVNAISMIPATMFWVTAAPVVKYTSMAFDLLVDKLRDTYL
ncbi:hypothetical protein OPT61_g8750 [Boeremia exigua]|uniref:Uncharacterized protein n=1 Tax=Boeremia exigua TaxID=749465 RepID=A0ACC2HXE6_9PLEO|nr:hypothetical protein OPT61_g8750 [Boeremia exigua]